MYSYRRNVAHSSFQTGPTGTQEPSNERKRRHNETDYYYSRTSEIKEEVEEEEEESVLALDLRIGKATESISIFDDNNVLASTSSGFGPALPRPGQTRMSSKYPTTAQYTTQEQHQQKSTSISSARSPQSQSANEHRIFRQPQNVSPRQIDCRKRFLEVTLYTPSTPSPQPASPPPRNTLAPSPMMDSLQIKPTDLMPSHFLLDDNYSLSRSRVHNYSRPTQPSLDRSDLLQNGRVNGQAKLSIWRPNLGSHPSTHLIHSQLFCNPSSPYGCNVPGCVQPHSLTTNRSTSPALEYSMRDVRSPHRSGGQKYHLDQPPRSFDHPKLKIFRHKNSSYSFSRNDRQVQTMVIKNEIPSPPRISPMFRQSPGQPHVRVRTFQDTLLLERAFETSDPVEYKSSYLHHVLQRQRQQTSKTADFFRRYYSSSAAACSSQHQPEEEVSELDQRLRLIEQDSRRHDTGRRQETVRRRTPSHVTPPSQFSLEPVSTTPIRSSDSVLPLNLSKASNGMLAQDINDEEDPDFRWTLRTGDREGHPLISPYRETAAIPSHFKPLSSALDSSTSTPPPQMSTFAATLGTESPLCLSPFFLRQSNRLTYVKRTI